MTSLLDTDHVYMKLLKLQQNSVVVGVPYQDNFLNMVGLVQEHGAHIKAKTGKYLVIPTRAAKGRKTSEIEGLYKRGHTLGVNEATSPNGYQVLFILKESVVIPARPWLAHTYSNFGKDWVNLYRTEVAKCINDYDYPFTDVYNALGNRMVRDVKHVLREYGTPNNAPLTVANKGKDDPLIDTGSMIDSIRWMLERRLD